MTGDVGTSVLTGLLDLPGVDARLQKETSILALLFRESGTC